MSRARSGLALVIALVLALPVLAGVGYAVAGSLGRAGSAAGASGNAWSLLAMASTWRSVGWSLWVAAASTALATFGAGLIALNFRGDHLHDRAARLLALVPLPIPHLVAALVALQLLGQSGWLARVGYAAGLWSGPGTTPVLVYDQWGIGLVLTLAWKEAPFLALVAMSVLATRGVALEEAARTLGARPGEVLRRVTLPLLWRGLLPAIVAVFIFVFGVYDATAVLAPSDPLALPLLTLERYRDATAAGRAGAYVLVLLAFGVAALAVAAHEWTRAVVERSA